MRIATLKMIKEVSIYIENNLQWKHELLRLRKLILGFELNEEYKWRNPCYTRNGKNIVLIGCSKNHCSLSFFKGALLKDPKGILQKIGAHTRSAKLIPFKSVKEICEQEDQIKIFIREAIAVEDKGLKVNFQSSGKLEHPVELQELFNKKPEFRKAFENLTKGRQRGYLLHFGGAKQSKTRIARIEKYQQRILNGKGILDCVCGLSKRMPNCDGSHKQLTKT